MRVSKKCCIFENMKKHDVTIVVPVYRLDLNRYEQISLRQLFATLGSRRIVVVKPQSLDVSGLLDGRNVPTESFDDSYFAGIAGYNRLMLSEEFYRRFDDSEYILIYQLDAYVFDDSLDRWLRKGYDYVGAPWPEKPVYRFPPYRLCSWLKRQWCKANGKPHRSATRGKVGNGGLSLRRVDSHLRALKELQPVVERYLTAPRHHMFNEDVFFGVEVARQGVGFRYPHWKEALEFSFDKYPARCYKWNNRRLPFGCHSWYKRKMKHFWFPIILPKHEL